jgi:D-alanyl-D-alanine carboxypeptidase
MKRTQKRPWYRKPAWLVSIAAVLVALGVVLFFLLRSGDKKEPEVPDNPPVEDPTPAPDPTPTPDPEPEPTPDPSQGSYTEGEQTDGVWNLVLVNPWNPLPEDFSVDIEPLDNTRGVDKQLQKMMDDCRAAGYSPYICSSYRTQAMQQENFNRQVDIFKGQGYDEEEAQELAAREVAVPGTSEHQLGLAVDIIDTDNWNLDESQESMPTQQWLMANSWRYGFILRYPTGTTDITGIIYEPWHYRYVGCQVAKEIYQRGITLEEYLGRAEH